MNWIGLWTIFAKEMRRSKKVAIQAFLSPVITTLLYFLIFGTVIGSRVGGVSGIAYDQFIVPGLIILSLVTNSLLSASSGIYFPRFTGAIVELLTAPLSSFEIASGYALSAVSRSLAIGLTIFVVAYLFTGITVEHIAFTLLFTFLISLTFSLLGLIIGIWAKDFEALAFIPSLIITPLSFFGGIFYSIEMLPGFWKTLTLWNPIFYMVDGLRYGFFGISDMSPLVSLFVVCGLLLVGFFTLYRFFATGYGLKT